MKTVLFVNHTPKQCGVYQFGKDIFKPISASSNFSFIKAEVESLKELKSAIHEYKPEIIIYNYHPSVMEWVTTKKSKGVYKNNIADINCIQLGIIHEITQEVADAAVTKTEYFLGGSEKKLNSLFDFYIAADPTLLLMNPLVYKTGRLVPTYNIEKNKPKAHGTIPIIGSMGFATPNKGFEELVKKVQEEFDTAIIKLNIPSAYFGDTLGENARKIADNCKQIITKPGIELQISFDFLDEQNMLDFLAGNDLNAFFYQDKGGRGLSSALDNALAVHRPITVTNCPMFRHILSARPSVCIEDNSLKTILGNGFAPLQQFADEWDSENLLWEYERILNAVTTKKIVGFSKKPLKKRIAHFFKRSLSVSEKPFTWLRDSESATKDDIRIDQSLKYTPVSLPAGTVYNRILDDNAREIYRPAINLIKKALPHTMSKKIDRANVQQAFVFDTVFRFMKDYETPKMLCVGSYEDTASLTLIKMGYKVEEIDPMINFYLQEYYTKPSVKKNSYDIIFSTSVIEHDPNDESFIRSIEGLLAPGGLGVITCDYKDGWQPGQPKPDVDARFYTKKDLEERLLSYLPDCTLIDAGQWDCPNPDFVLENRYTYTFATFVFKKNEV